MGYHTGDFDYTTLDNQWWTQPVGPGVGLHFMSPDKAMARVQLAIRSGDVNRFQEAMHSLQDTFSHYNKGYRTIGNGDLGHWHAPDKGHEPDNPYAPGATKVTDLDYAYRAADRITKELEGQWYLMWEGPERWFKLH